MKHGEGGLQESLIHTLLAGVVVLAPDQQAINNKNNVRGKCTLNEKYKLHTGSY